MTRTRALTVALGALSTAIAIGGYGARLAAQQLPPPPRTEIRVSRSGIDLAALDQTVSPCDDFLQVRLRRVDAEAFGATRSAARRPLRRAAEPETES